MVRHVVMWKLKSEAEGNGKLKNMELVIETLLSLKPLISQISSLEVGKNFNLSEAAFDLVLITTHDDKETLVQYINHPAHQEAAAFIGKVVAERKVVDFEY